MKMKYGVRVPKESIQWFACKAMAEDFFKQKDTAQLVIGDDANYLPYSFRMDGREITEEEYSHNAGYSDGRFCVCAIGDDDKELFSGEYENRSQAGDIFDAVLTSLRAAGVEFSAYMIDLDLQLETFA